MGNIFVFKVLSERWFSDFPDVQNGDWRVTAEFSQVCFWTGESILGVQDGICGISQPRAWHLIKGPLTCLGLRCV